MKRHRRSLHPPKSGRVLTGPGFFSIEQLESRMLLSVSDFDSTFGTGGASGKSLSGIVGGQGCASVTQSDGKVLVAGFASSPAGFTQAVVDRYNADGTPDSTFGISGQNMIPAGAWSSANAIALQSDGKIVLAGATGTSSASTHSLIVRLNSDGSLDSTFNSTGMEVVTFGQVRDLADALALQPDGKIIIGGAAQYVSGEMRYSVARIGSAGGLDASFGSGGLLTTAITNNPYSHDTITGMAVDSSGRLIATGMIGTLFYGGTFGVVRYTASGTLDTSFGAGGISTTLFPGTCESVTDVVQADGKILVGGMINGSFGIARYTPNGTLDTTFGSGGSYTYTAQSSACNAITVIANGTIVGSGSLYLYGSFNGAGGIAVRLSAAGALDTSFGQAGTVVLGNQYNIFGGSVSAAGAIDLVGTSKSDFTLTVAQLTAGGSADNTFGSSGFAHSRFILPTTSSAITSITQEDGKMVIAGNYSADLTTSNGSAGVMTRLNSGGSIDTSFGNNGVVIDAFPSNFTLEALAVLPSGAIVTAGVKSNPSPSLASTLVQRFLPNGALDISFGVNGVTTLNFNNALKANQVVVALLPLADGRLSLVVRDGQGTSLFRLTAAGALDTTYGTGADGVRSAFSLAAATLNPAGQLVAATYTGSGGALLYSASGSQIAGCGFNYDFSPRGGSNAITFASDGDVLIAGSAIGASAAVAAVGTDWLVDTRFGQSGYAKLLTNGAVYSSIGVLASGEVLAAGNVGGGTSSQQMICTMFDASGHLVTSFGSGGTLVSSAGNSVSTIAIRPDGKIDLIGTAGPNIGALQLLGEVPDVLLARSTPVTLTQNPDHQSVDWTMGLLRGNIAITDSAGLTISGDQSTNSIINLNYTNGIPLPNTIHLNGVYAINGMTGTNPLANTNVDIGSGPVYISYAGPAADPINMLRGYLRNGYANGSWNGAPTSTTGVITSSTAAADTSRTTGIGYADSADGLLALPANTIELKYTLYGDTGLTGSVGFTDFMRMTQHYTIASGATWGQGDFNYDGSVGQADFNLLQPNYGLTLPSASATPAVSAPPPASSQSSAGAPTGGAGTSSSVSQITVDPVETVSKKHVKAKQKLKNNFLRTEKYMGS